MEMPLARSLPRRSIVLASFALGLSLAGCHRPRVGPSQSGVIRLGVEGGPHAEIAEIAKVSLAKEGVKLQILELSNYTRPNAALQDGDLDADSYQHQPYLDAQIEARGKLLVVRREDKDAPWVQKLVAAYHSEEVRRFVLAKYPGVVVPGL